MTKNTAQEIDLRRPEPRVIKGYTRPVEPNRGDRDVYVDGERWGCFRSSSHGMYGLRYVLFDSLGREVDTDGKISSVSQRHRCYNTQRQIDPQAPKTTAEALERAVRAAINAGQLVHPAKAKAEHDAAVARMTANREAAKKREAEAFHNKALEALGGAAKPEVLDRVIAAMRWAQSQ